MKLTKKEQFESNQKELKARKEKDLKQIKVLEKEINVLEVELKQIGNMNEDRSWEVLEEIEMKNETIDCLYESISAIDEVL